MQSSVAEPLPLPSQASLLLPLFGSLLVTGAVAAFLCIPPKLHTHSIAALLVLAAIYLLLAAAAHALAVWLVHRIFQEHLPVRARALMVALWTTVAWLPLLSLLTSERSFWVAVTLPVIGAFALLFLKRSQPEPEPDDFVRRPELFQPPTTTPFWKALLPSAIAACALQAAVFAAASGRYWLSGLCMAGFLALPIWKLVRSRRGAAGLDERINTRNIARDSLAAWALTALALLPFLPESRLAQAIDEGLLRDHPPNPATAHAATPGRAGSGHLQFIVLLQPAKPPEHRITPPKLASGGASPSQPHVIPFDGPYWYFKVPGTLPGPRARIEHGDSTKVNVHSTDLSPMLMEARQPLPQPLSLACCRSLRVSLTNADNRPGAIDADVILYSPQGNAPLLAQPIVSSHVAHIRLDRPPVDETLTFQIPAIFSGLEVNEIAVRLHPAHERELGAPQIAVRSFEFLP